MNGELVECLLALNDRDVTTLTDARRIVGELLGPGRHIEPVFGAPGTWLVEMNADEVAELKASRWLGRGNGAAELSAEYPL